VREAGFAIANVDATIVVERPKLAPFIEAMRANVASRISCSIDAVGINAKTSDGLGYTGDGTGLAAYAVALLQPRIDGPG
jgi:2-C-methyl-D-erythritol 2,4-cyclodiphosphate synthase